MVVFINSCLIVPFSSLVAGGDSHAAGLPPTARLLPASLVWPQALAEKARAQNRPPQDLESDVVVEEVFENERFQPFRWGQGAWRRWAPG